VATPPEDWDGVKALFKGALERRPEQRSAYLLENAANQAVRQEVERLLAEHEQAGSFLSGPAFEGLQHQTNPLRHRFEPGGILARRFRIVRFIAAGGMGEVYEAQDLELRENLAIKTIKPGVLQQPNALERFKREVHLARRVTHPNVCRVFDLFRHVPDAHEADQEAVFVSMELLQGEALSQCIRRSGSLAPDEAFPVIAQIASGLGAAHRAGVVHRDFKPSNVVLVSDGNSALIRAVITDFGLARSGPDASWTADFNTLTGICGTLAYMAPEQIESSEVTSAADIYALGLVIHEMMTGVLPFASQTPLGMLVRRMHEPIPSPRLLKRNLDSAWESAILRCLDREPGSRFHTVEELVQALEKAMKLPYQSPAGARADLRLSRNADSGQSSAEEQARSFATIPTGTTDRSIVVLPFGNLSSDPENEFFADGITEEIINALAQIEDLRVAARTSAFSFKGTHMDLRTVGSRLNVATVLEGSVRKLGNRLRIMADLVSISDGYHLWSERYDRELQDIFEVQDEIAKTIADRLKLTLGTGRQKQLVRAGTKDLEAYEFYLKGRFYWNKRTRVGIEKAIEYFRLAMLNDREFAHPLVGLAECHIIQGLYGTHEPHRVFPLAKDAVFKALAIDPQAVDAHCAAGCIQAVYDWDWAGAQRSFQRAFDLDPNCSTAHHWYAVNYLIPRSQFEEARLHLRIARDSDPLSLAINSTMALQSYFERHYDQAMLGYLGVLEMDPTFGVAVFFLGQAYEQKNILPEAITAFERAVVLTERSPETVAALGRAYALAGRIEDAGTLLNELQQISQSQYVSPILFAQLMLALGERTRAIQFLHKGVELRATDIIWLGVRPTFDVIRHDESFRAICAQVGLA
jgi:eukaryotic-like serine/threonine-protein kinase